MESKELLKDGCQQLGINLEVHQIQQFMDYYKLLIQWNEKINLTAITEEKEVIIKHFLDSLSAVRGYDFSQDISMIDVGTGAGFPGFPIKIAFPNVKLTALDALNKRINYLKQVVEQLELEEVHCIHSRAEDGAKDEHLRENFDICISRAVADLGILCEYCLPFVKVGGKFISLKGPNISKEILGAEKAIEILGGRLEEIKYVDLPFSNLKHNLVIITKVDTTPLKYPRKPSKIKKSIL